MSLTVSNNLSQQPAIQTQVAPAKSTASATASGSAADNSKTPQTPTSVADALTSGKAALSSDLLSVLLNEQSNQSVMPSTTLAGMLDQQDQAIATGDTLQFDPTGGGTSAGSQTLAGILDQQSQASSSADATNNVLGSLPALLSQING